MANTIRVAKNTFNGGLVMDLSPDNTPNEVLSSALNATLVTFNGNELLLQNDMGNGRVETARLPEGYIPVGTCEFGDIIYIVSYNPLTNKSLIGCFPSPERNISSEETGGTNQTLSASDFLELDGSGNPTGKLKASSVKKIIYNNKLNPGDKFIIYDKTDSSTASILNEPYITDIGNTSHVYGTFPKLLRIHVISIEDSGKITYLDSSVRWYNSVINNKSIDYFIRKSETVNGKLVPDIDSYRNMLSSGYSVYQSKISGKLALLIELEKITGFSCTYSIYSKKGLVFKANNNGPTASTGTDVYFTNYLTYLNFNWETDDYDVNPCCVVLTDYSWQGIDKSNYGKLRFWKYANNEWELKDYVDPNGFSHSMDPITTNLSSADSDVFWIDAVRNFGLNTNESDVGYTYSDFLVNNYKSKLLGFVNGVFTNYPEYKKEVLSKLNIYKESSNGYINVPSPGKYYINAVHSEKTEKEESGLVTYSIKYYSKSSENGKLFEISEISIPDYIVNNYFHYPIYKKFLSFQMPTSLEVIFKEKVQQTNDQGEPVYNNGEPVMVDGENVLEIIKNIPDLSNMIFKFDITPAMPYGLLEEFTITNYIDFSKIGTGYINLNTWKYFVGENSLTLTLGLDTYVEDNMGISEVSIRFYDNQGVAAVYHITNKSSYSGQFTEVIPLNGSTVKPNLNNVDGMESFIHCGAELSEYKEGSVTYELNLDNEITVSLANENSDKWYDNDCGVLYQGMLYLAKIIVKYCPKDALDNYDDTDSSNFKIFNRWLWTTTMYNDLYYQTRDFNDLKFLLAFDVGPIYSTTDQYYYGKFDYNSSNTNTLADSSELYSYLSSIVLVITTSDKVNLEDTEEIINPDNPEDLTPPIWNESWAIRGNSTRVEVSADCGGNHISNVQLHFDKIKIYAYSNTDNGLVREDLGANFSTPNISSNQTSIAVLLEFMRSYEDSIKSLLRAKAGVDILNYAITIETGKGWVTYNWYDTPMEAPSLNAVNFNLNTSYGNLNEDSEDSEDD